MSTSQNGHRNAGDRAREARQTILGNLPLWLKLVLGIGALLVATWTIMITLTYLQQRESAIAQAREFAASANYSRCRTCAITSARTASPVMPATRVRSWAP